jgi:pyocin large subunit-like protein
LAGTKMIIAKIIYLGRQVTQAIQSSQASQSAKSTLTFRSDSLCEEHFEKHGIEMGFASAKEYEKAAAAVVSDSRALHKLEKEDGDDVYYLKDTNEFVIVSTDGYIRTYFYPIDGIEYFERQ